MKKIKTTLSSLSAAKGDSIGEINLQWDSVENAESYIIEISNSNHRKGIKWKVLDIVSDPCYTVRKLKSKKNYFFRVASVSKDGKKKLSGEIDKTAP